MAFKKDRVKPTPYPFLPFHAIRSAQLVSSLIVASIMFYFLRELNKSNYSLPWTFILLLTVSLFTLISLALTIILHVLHGLNPGLNLALNGALSLLWVVSFSLLAWWSSSTLSHVCNAKNWESEMGVEVCRMYKALFSFALLGSVATLGATGLDVHVQRSTTRKGKFISLGMVNGKRDGGNRREFSDEVGDGAWDTAPNAAAQRDTGRTRRGGGYAVPEEQFRYEDTAYTGPAGQVGRISLDMRL